VKRSEHLVAERIELEGEVLLGDECVPSAGWTIAHDVCRFVHADQLLEPLAGSDTNVIDSHDRLPRSATQDSSEATL
jgi:hypothetical protein